MKKGSFRIFNRSMQAGAPQRLVIVAADHFMLGPGASIVVDHFTRQEVSYERRGFLIGDEAGSTSPWTDSGPHFIERKYEEGFRPDDAPSLAPAPAATPEPEPEPAPSTPEQTPERETGEATPPSDETPEADSTPSEPEPESTDSSPEPEEEAVDSDPKPAEFEGWPLHWDELPEDGGQSVIEALRSAGHEEPAAVQSLRASDIRDIAQQTGLTQKAIKAYVSQTRGLLG